MRFNPDSLVVAEMAALSPPSAQRHKEKCCPQIPCLYSSTFSVTHLTTWGLYCSHLLIVPVALQSPAQVCACVFPCIILTNTVHAWVRLNSQSIFLECVCALHLYSSSVTDADSNAAAKLITGANLAQKHMAILSTHQPSQCPSYIPLSTYQPMPIRTAMLAR